MGLNKGYSGRDKRYKNTEGKSNECQGLTANQRVPSGMWGGTTALRDFKVKTKFCQREIYR